MICVCAGRSEEHISLIESYLQTSCLFRDYVNTEEDPVFSEVIELDLSSVVPSLSGPKRPQDRIPVTDMKEDFSLCLRNKVVRWNKVIVDIFLYYNEIVFTI